MNRNVSVCVACKTPYHHGAVVAVILATRRSTDGRTETRGVSIELALTALLLLLLLLQKHTT